MAHGPIKYEWFLSRSICSIDRNLRDTTNPGKKKHGSNGKRGVLHALQNWTSPSDPVYYHTHTHTGYLFFRVFNLSVGDTVSRKKKKRRVTCLVIEGVSFFSLVPVLIIWTQIKVKILNAHFQGKQHFPA